MGANFSASTSRQSKLDYIYRKTSGEKNYVRSKNQQYIVTKRKYPKCRGEIVINRIYFEHSL